MEPPERMYLQEVALQEVQVYKVLLPCLAALPLAQDYLPYAAVPADAWVLVHAEQKSCQRWVWAFPEFYQVQGLQPLPACESQEATYHLVHCCSSYVHPCFPVSNLEMQIYGLTQNYRNYRRYAVPSYLKDTQPFDVCRGLSLLCHCRQTQSAKSAACRDNVR